MDGGSFIFELNGVRWVVDPGNQDYNDLEQTGFDLWGKCQNVNDGLCSPKITLDTAHSP